VTSDYTINNYYGNYMRNNTTGDNDYGEDTSNNTTSNKDYDDSMSNYNHNKNTTTAGGNKVKCDECDETFANEEAQKDHMEEKHGGKFKCFKCDRGFATKEKRTKHMNGGTCSKK
jgi:uncharacterized C2H2 Zn-finger protein